ncbi:MAG: hypothetical protein ACLQO1_04490 [Steroidobacteraceae bacterium]
MTRKRSPSNAAKYREWWARHAAYLKRERAKLPPRPDPKTHAKEFLEWVRSNARSEFTAEEKRLWAGLNALPKSKRRDRDAARWWMIYCLLGHQRRGGYNLMKCSLGKYPGIGGKGSAQLQDFLAILKADDQPNITSAQLYDSIREWRKRRQEMSPPLP